MKYFFKIHQTNSGFKIVSRNSEEHGLTSNNIDNILGNHANEIGIILREMLVNLGLEPQLALELNFPLGNIKEINIKDFSTRLFFHITDIRENEDGSEDIHFYPTKLEVD